MKCHVCGADMRSVVLDLPFKMAPRRTVIVNELPALQCSQCPEIALDDPVMARVEELLKAVDQGARLEVIQFAA